jgi:hypothetical protein
MRIHRARVVACSLGAASLVLLGTPVRARAQVSGSMRAQDVGINAAIGLATATVWSIVRGHGVTGGLQRGLIGGVVMSAGRQVAASPFHGAGFTGREISAAGISLIASVGREHPTLTFPVGPVELQLVDGRAFDWRVNATDAIAAVVIAARKDTRLDAGLSLSSGTLVFRRKGATFHTSSGEASGSEFFQSINLAGDAFRGSTGTPKVLYHENVHVLQDDFLTDAVTDPIENAILSHTSTGRRITRHIDIGLLSLAVNAAANSSVPYASRPWEREAYAITPLHNY